MDAIDGLTEDERLALLVAMGKRVNDALGDAKAVARTSLLEEFERTHADRRAVMVGAEKVGEVGISYASARPYVLPGMEREAMERLRDAGLVEEVPAKGWEARYEMVGGSVVDRETGELCPWLGWQPRSAKGASVRGCDPEDVQRALGQRLSPGARALLSDGAL